MKTITFWLSCLVAGALAGWWMSASRPVPADVAAKKTSRPIADAGSRASERALRARIRSLEAMFAARPAVKAATNEHGHVSWSVRTNLNGRVVSQAWFGRPADFKSYGEDMRAKSPDAFAKWVEKFESSAAKRQQGYDDRIASLSSIDTSWMDASEQNRFDRFLGALKNLSDDQGVLGQWDLPVEERGRYDRLSSDHLDEMEDLKDWCRDSLLRRTADILGFSGEESGQFVKDMKTIDAFTDIHLPYLADGEEPPSGQPSEP